MVQQIAIYSRLKMYMAQKSKRTTNKTVFVSQFFIHTWCLRFRRLGRGYLVGGEEGGEKSGRGRGKLLFPHTVGPNRRACAVNHRLFPLSGRPHVAKALSV